MYIEREKPDAAGRAVIIRSDRLPVSSCYVRDAAASPVQPVLRTDVTRIADDARQRNRISQRLTPLLSLKRLYRMFVFLNDGTSL